MISRVFIQVDKSSLLVILGFSTESPTSLEIPQSWQNWAVGYPSGTDILLNEVIGKDMRIDIATYGVRMVIIWGQRVNEEDGVKQEVIKINLLFACTSTFNIPLHLSSLSVHQTCYEPCWED